MMLQHASTPIAPFNPATWLTSYVELGGAFTANAFGACIHRSGRVGDVDLEALAAHEDQLIRDPSAQCAVKAYLTSLLKAETQP